MKQVQKGAYALSSLEMLSVGRSVGETGSLAGSLTVSQVKKGKPGNSRVLQPRGGHGGARGDEA